VKNTLRSCYCALALISLSLIGCDSDPGPQAHIEKVVPVSGTLTYLGQPLESYQVRFLPSDGRRAATGVTDAAGKFTMGTNNAGDGAPPGEHSVAIVWVAPNVDNPGNEQIIDDPALLPKPKVKIPEQYGNPTTSGLTQNVPDSGITDLKIDLK
jgi:hypothetical protein